MLCCNQAGALIVAHQGGSFVPRHGLVFVFRMLPSKWHTGLTNVVMFQNLQVWKPVMECLAACRRREMKRNLSRRDLDMKAYQTLSCASRDETHARRAYLLSIGAGASQHCAGMQQEVYEAKLKRKQDELVGNEQGDSLNLLRRLLTRRGK